MHSRIDNKRNAYRFQIRKRHLNQTMQKMRKQIWEENRQQDSQIVHLLQNLPNSLINLTEHPQAIVVDHIVKQNLPFLKEKIQACEKIVSLLNYMYLLQRVCIVIKNQSKQAQFLVKEIIPIVLYKAQRMAERSPEQKKIIYQQTLTLINDIDQNCVYLDQKSIRLTAEFIKFYLNCIFPTSEVRQKISYELSQPFQIINNLITMLSFYEEKQNLSQDLRSILAYKCLYFAQCLFYQDTIFIKTYIDYIFMIVEDEQKDVLQLSLRIIVNLTYIEKQPIASEEWAHRNICCLIIHLFQNNSNEIVLRLAIQLVNNLIYSSSMCFRKFEQLFLLRKIVKWMQTGPYVPIRQDFYSLLCTYVDRYFVQDQENLDLQLIDHDGRNLHDLIVERGVPLLLVRWLCESESSKYNSQVKLQILNSIFIIIRTSFDQIKQQICKPQYKKYIQLLMEDVNSQISDMSESILAELQAQQNECYS